MLDENYTGVQSLEVIEQKGVAWTDVDTTEETVLEKYLIEILDGERDKACSRFKKDDNG